MILSRGRRYLFVHIPKTGGTALALALEARAMADDLLIGDTPKAKRRRGRLTGIETRGRLWKHSTLAEAEGLYEPSELPDLFTLTLVRNPWDRMVSYYHWLRAQRFDHPAVAVAKAQDFSSFLNRKEIAAAIRANPYGRYMQDGTGREICTLFARIEQFATDIAPFETHLGFGLAPLAVANASQRPVDYRNAYSDRDAALVADLCKEDIARFGYRFDSTSA